MVTRDPAGEPIEPIHIDSEHGKALVKMGPLQAGQFMANILAPNRAQVRFARTASTL